MSALQESVWDKAGVQGVLSSDDEYRFAVAADLAAHGLSSWPRWSRRRAPSLHFQGLLRQLESFARNRGPAARAQRLAVLLRFQRLSEALGYTIPPGVFGPGLCLVHRGTIVVNAGAVVGRNCRVHHDVTIGQSDGGNPVVGDDVWIGPGAKVFGGVRIGDGVAIGANAVVLRDVPSGVTVAGVPARIVSQQGSRGLLVDGCAVAARS